MFLDTKDRDRTSEEKYSHERNRVIPPTETKNRGVLPTSKPKTVHPAKVDFGSSEDTFEDNRREYQYKTNLNNNQNSHQDFGMNFENACLLISVTSKKSPFNMTFSLSCNKSQYVRSFLISLTF